jgi:hypothetical protein
MTREQALKEAFFLTIKAVGLAKLKETSMFGSAGLLVEQLKAA